ncbi:MAG TPA: S8 family serine peptidase [Firmicutes bacterium]|nr:S8 family serine peptidase [Bacillota bacterium]HHT43067.1 S8 family serine peptidase [Bacillota bacterium]
MKKLHGLGVLLLAAILLLAGCLGGGGSKEYSISGVVQDALGIPLAGVELSVEGSEITPRVVGPTGADGKWSVDGLTGRVTVEAAKEGWFFSPKVQEFTKAAEGVVITAVRGESLTINIEGEGQVEQEVVVTPLSSDYYERDTQVKLTAVPDFDWRFVRWEGDVPEGKEEDNPIIIVMDEPKEITAVFVPTTTVNVAVEIEHLFPQAYEQVAELGPEALAASASSRGLRLEPASELEEEYAENEFIVRLDKSLSREEQVRILEEAGYRVLDTIEILGAHLVTPREAGISALGHEDHMQILAGLSGALSVDPNYAISVQAIKLPNDRFYESYQWWNYDQIRLPQAWSVTTGDSNIRVAVIDTGIDPDHPDLEGKIDLENAWDFTDDNDIEDFHGHGTHVAGTIGASTNNEIGVAGVMWEVELLPVKVFDASGRGSNWTVVQGILYAAGLLNDQEDKPTNPRPADIVNMSLGGPYTQFEEHSVQEAYARGVILVAATGNDARPVISYPAAHPEVIAVGATASGLHLLPGPYEPPIAPYSNHGSSGDFVMAPGGGGYAFGLGIMDFVVSTGDAGSYYGSSGTSMATPHVSGVIGLMLANGIPKSQVREVLERTAMKIYDRDTYHYGHGLINAYWAVNAVEEIRLIQGLRNGTEITIVSEGRTNLSGDQTLMYLEAGEYQLIAWIDVNGNNILDVGDYYSETPVLEFEYGQGWSWWPTVSEFHPVDYQEDLDEAAARTGSYELVRH